MKTPSSSEIRIVDNIAFKAEGRALGGETFWYCVESTLQFELSVVEEDGRWKVLIEANSIFEPDNALARTWWIAAACKLAKQLEDETKMNKKTSDHE